MDIKVQYDNKAKDLLSQKIILAHILAGVVDEFRGLNPGDIVKYIEGEPYVGIVPLDSGYTNEEYPDKTGSKIIGMNTESEEINEGIIRFDILFYVRTPNGVSKIIINVEAQKGTNLSYFLLNRAIFYGCRLISSQKSRDFTNSNYNDLQTVYTIWLVMNRDKCSITHIHLTKDNILGEYDWNGNLDMLNIVFVGLSNQPPEYEEKYKLLRLLSVLFSDILDKEEKCNILNNEYDMGSYDAVERNVVDMCNLSLGIEERGIEQGIEGMIYNMYTKGYTKEQIADVSNKTVEEINMIIKNCSQK